MKKRLEIHRGISKAVNEFMNCKGFIDNSDNSNDLLEILYSICEDWDGLDMETQTELQNICLHKIELYPDIQGVRNGKLYKFHVPKKSDKTELEIFYIKNNWAFEWDFDEIPQDIIIEIVRLKWAATSEEIKGMCIND